MAAIATAIGRLLISARTHIRPVRASPAFRRLCIGQAVSLLGTQITRVAVPLQVYAITRSSLDVAFVALAGLVPLVAFGLYGGAMADLRGRGAWC